MTRALAKPLTPAQQRFVDEYMQCRVATRAAIAAGYGTSSAGGLMQTCKAEIDRRLALCREAAEITEQRVARELAEVAFADPADLFDEDGRLLPVRKMPVSIRRALASIEVEALYEMVQEEPGERPRRMQVGTTTKLKFWNKVDALEKLGKYKGMFIERHQVDGRMVQYVIHAPMPAATSADWAKKVHAQIVAEERRQ